MKKRLRIGILAGESSGDILGAGLMAEIISRYPDVKFEGIGGPLMAEHGLVSQVPMERLSVMGLVEVLKHLPELLRIRKKLKLHFTNSPPDIFIGIDLPDFNLGLEAKLRKAGIPTVHYVSPSVWAWRQKRIKKIGRAANLVLTLFPFEANIYHQNKIPVSFVGHPLADQIDLEVDSEQARQELGLALESKVIALLPGSRQGEVARLAPPFLRTARLCSQQWPDLQIVLPCANKHRKQQLESLIEEEFSDLSNTKLVDGQSRTVMAASDFILIASGTATLEALLLKKPMLVCYRMAPLSYAIISRLLKVPYFSLPNLLAGKKLVEELVQDEVNEKNLFSKILHLLTDNAEQAQLVEEYQQIHQTLRQNASQRAALEVLKLLE